MPEKLRINGVIGESVVDGPGIRTVVFVQGCPLRCPGCHNPQTHSFDGGYEEEVGDLLAEIRSDPLLSGVTFSGGEPMCQAGALCDLAKGARGFGLHVAVYTGYTFEELLAENDPDRMRLLSLSDVLIDGPFVMEKRNLTLRFKGSSNQRILDVRRSLLSGAAVDSLDTEWIGRTE